jgi:fructokinase
MKIIGAGLVAVDIIQFCDSRWRPKPVAPFYTSGGTVGNILCYLSAFGYDCSLAGIIGKDEMALVLKQGLQAFGVKTDQLIPRAGVSTRRIGHLISVEGRNRGMHKFLMQCFSCQQQFPKVPVPSMRDVESRIYERLKARTLLVIDRANTFTLELAQIITSKKGLVLFEPGHFPRENNIVSRLMEHVDILKYSEELRSREEGFGEMFLEKQPRLKLIIETRGRGGVKIILPRRNREIRLNTTFETRDMNVLDSSGAGDAFTAGFLINIGEKGLRNVDGLDNEKLEEAINCGQAMGALACLFHGSKGLLYAKTREEITEAVASITRSRTLPVDFDKFPRINLKKFRNTRDNICKICRLESRRPA